MIVEIALLALLDKGSAKLFSIFYQTLKDDFGKIT